MIKIIGIELKRSSGKTTLFFFLSILFTALFLNYPGIEKTKRLEQTKLEFIKIETQKLENFSEYRQYNWIGFRLLFFPSSIGVMFSQTTLNNLQAASDMGYRFEVSNPQKGENMFQRSSGLAWFILVVMGGFVSAFGWRSLRNREYLRMLSVYGSKFFVYSSIVLARALFLFLALLILMVLLLLQYSLFGISLSGADIIITVKAMTFIFAVQLIFLMFGAALGTMKKALKSLAILFSCWLIFLILWPLFFNAIFSRKAENLRSIYSIEAENVKLLSDFEKQRFDYIKDKEDKLRATKEFTEKFLAEAKVEKLEIALLRDTAKIAETYHKWSIINSGTFFEAVLNELSSRGFNEQLRFWKKSLVKKREFTRYCLDKMFQPQTGKVEPFLKGDEYIYYARPSLPDSFWLGALVQALYFLVLFIIGFFRFNRIVFTPGEELSRDELEEFIIEEKKYNIWFSRDCRLGNTLFNIFTKKDFGRLKGKSAELARRYEHFFYLCRPDEIPADIRVTDFIKSFSGAEFKTILDRPEIKPLAGKTFSEISNNQKCTLLLGLMRMRKKAIYLLDDVDMALDINTVKLTEAMLEAIQNGSIAIFISRSALEVENIKGNIEMEHRWDMKIGYLKTAVEKAKKP